MNRRIDGPGKIDRSVRMSLAERRWRQSPDYVPPPPPAPGEKRREGLVLFLAFVILVAAFGGGIWLGIL
ncbi:hypothetical protein [Pararhodobacter aggregans]